MTLVGAASAKAALPVLSLLSFDVFDFPVPRCLSLIRFACFFHWMDVIFFLPFEALKETFIYIYILTCDCGPDVDFLAWG